MLIVYCVHWLKAKARMNRWGEDKALTLSEMVWVPLFFIHQADEWHSRSLKDGEASNSGKACYARKMESMWRQLHVDAETRFQDARTALRLRVAI